MTTKDWTLLREGAEEQTYKKGTRVIRAGQRNDDYLFKVRGMNPSAVVNVLKVMSGELNVLVPLKGQEKDKKAPLNVRILLNSAISPSSLYSS